MARWATASLTLPFVSRCQFSVCGGRLPVNVRQVTGETSRDRESLWPVNERCTGTVNHGLDVQTIQANKQFKQSWSCDAVYLAPRNNKGSCGKKIKQCTIHLFPVWHLMTININWRMFKFVTSLWPGVNRSKEWGHKVKRTQYKHQSWPGAKLERGVFYDDHCPDKFWLWRLNLNLFQGQTVGTCWS